ncbi:hypothetical protein CC80DRAFT_488187 [Byssothecium circinans]|uniref:PNPLA domain-containing protein n=1 Tax=Byssothecium circinans TaxID=147558 RepID=A0A6A5UBS2_9PLEO|nr:hypothetical protein CC80DRAFT_488187 [Byssothecium circinans]
MKKIKDEEGKAEKEEKRAREEERRGEQTGDGPQDSDEIGTVPTATSPAQLQGVDDDRATSDEAHDWLPCHYFDFMVGTSTGGLIAVLLGRL